MPTSERTPMIFTIFDVSISPYPIIQAANPPRNAPPKNIKKKYRAPIIVLSIIFIGRGKFHI